MTCSQCGNNVADEVDFCPKCGARQAGYAAPAGMAPAAHAAASRPSAVQAYSFDYRRWTMSDRIAGGASLVVLISLFLPWFSVNLAGLGAVGDATASGTDVHGWLWFVFIIGLAILVYLVLTAGFEVLPVKLPLQHDMLLLGATGINLLLVLLAFVLKPSADGTSVQIGWSFGAILALIAAIAAVVPLARAAARDRAAVSKAQ